MNFILDNTHTKLASLLVKEYAKKSNATSFKGDFTNFFRLAKLILSKNCKVRVCVNHCYRLKNIPVLFLCLLAKVEVYMVYEGIGLFRSRKVLEHYVAERYPRWLVYLCRKVDDNLIAKNILIPSFIAPISELRRDKTKSCLIVHCDWCSNKTKFEKTRLIVAQGDFDHQGFINQFEDQKLKDQFMILERNTGLPEFFEFGHFEIIVGGYSSVLLHAKLLAPTCPIFFSPDFTVLPPDWPHIQNIFYMAGLTSFKEHQR